MKTLLLTALAFACGSCIHRADLPTPQEKALRYQRYKIDAYYLLYEQWHTYIRYARSVGRGIYWDFEWRGPLAKDAHRHVAFLRRRLTNEDAVVLILDANPDLVRFARSKGFDPHGGVISEEIQKNWMRVLAEYPSKSE